MLVNKTDKSVTVQYNQIVIEVPPGGNLDVREFDISTGQTKPLNFLIPPVEKHIQKEHPGVFDITKTIDDPKVEKKYAEEITALRNQVAEQQGKIDLLTEQVNEAQEKNARDANEINGFGEKERGLTNKIIKLEKDLETTIEEYEAQLARIRGGAPASRVAE